MLHLQSLIVNNDNWREILSQKPYFIDIRENDDLILFKYSQIESDFNNDLVRECRGIILYKKDWTIACFPFEKFGNFSESYVPDINWDNVRILEKLDGSLIKLFFNKITNKWQWATNGTINAFDTTLGFDSDKSFGWLIYHTLELMGVDDKVLLDNLNINYTYLFELCTPLNRVVVPHKDYKLYYLTSKHNETGYEEVEELPWFPTPKSYDFSKLDDIIKASNELPFDEEGYVVVDNNFQRVKVKSPAYVHVHHLNNNGVITKTRVLDLIRINEHKEFLNYYPEYNDIFDEVENGYNNLVSKLNDDRIRLEEWMKENPESSRKDQALFIKEFSILPGSLFSFLDGKIKNMIDYIKDMPSDKVINYIGR